MSSDRANPTNDQFRLEIENLILATRCQVQRTPKVRRTWRLIVISVWLGVVCLLAACGGAGPSPTAQEPTPPAAATATVAAVPSATVAFLTEGCTLLNSRDVASLFSTAEVEGPRHQVSQVSHPIFSTESISATESSCIYDVFHRPGTKEQEFLEVTYWLDLPGPHVTPPAWAQVWATTRASAAQQVSGVGDAAFYDNGTLSFKKGTMYVTIEIIGTGVNPGTSAGAAQQLQMETQIALDAVGRLP
jgi:hypothetical protein